MAPELLARALAEEEGGGEQAPLKWPSQDLGLKVDLEDKDALFRALDER